LWLGVAIIIDLLRPKAAHNMSQLQRQKKTPETKNKIHQKLETIKQIAEQMK